MFPKADGVPCAQEGVSLRNIYEYGRFVLLCVPTFSVSSPWLASPMPDSSKARKKPERAARMLL